VQNKKMTKSSNESIVVYNFGIPAYISKTGIKTCPAAGTCKIGCYAQQGPYAWSTTQNAYEWRLAQTLEPNFVATMINAIRVKLTTAKRQGKQLYIRIHDSGDFYSPKYLSDWLEITKALPEVQFYAYTKQVLMVDRIYKESQANFIIVRSFGGIFDHKIDLSTRHARVFESESDLNAAGYVNVMENDLMAIGENRRIGLVYHGYKSKKWSA